MQAERWLAVPGYEGIYEVSDAAYRDRRAARAANPGKAA